MYMAIPQNYNGCCHIYFNLKEIIMKKSKSIISICAALSLMTAMSLSVSAEENSVYTGSVYLSKYALSAEEVASGNAYVNVTGYIRGRIHDNFKINGVQAGLAADPQIYMRNIVSPSRTYTEETYSCLGESFITAYKPFCFGKLSDNVYSPNSFICTTRDYCMDPIAGNYIIYSGNDTVTLKIPGRLYIDENGDRPNDKVSHEVVCPLTINPDGSANYSFYYADIYADHYDVALATGVIPYYQPELLNNGDYIPDINSKYGWATDLTSASSFLGNSNDFPLIQTDAYLKKDTPCGIYNIDINANDCDISAKLNDTSIHLSMKYQPAAVAVGVEKADMSAGDSMPVYACYFAEDTKVITGSSTGFDYICNVSYTDDTSESAKNVTGAVNAAISPSEIINSSSGNYFIGDIQMYCGDTPLTYNDKETKIKALIGKKGDVNLDGQVEISDATDVLRYYAEEMAGLKPELPVDNTGFQNTLSFFLGDIDTESQIMKDGGTLDINDATSILSYYANSMAGNHISWDKYIK